MRHDKDAMLEALDYRAFWETELGGRITSRYGSNWTARSPFREDRHPSLSVNVETGLWKDFAGDGGDAIGFIQQLHDLDFPAALEYIEARHLGHVPLPYNGLPGLKTGRVVRPCPAPKVEAPRTCPPEECRFIEIVKAAPQQRNSFPMFELRDKTICPLLHDWETGGEAYVSAWGFSREAVEYRKSKAGSLAGYRGPVRPFGWFWDFDGPEEDPIKTGWDAVELAERLITRGFSEKDIHVSFSGRKGFHVVLCDEDVAQLPAASDVPSLIKKICLDVAKGLKTADPSVYGPTQLFREMGSLHPKTRLRKQAISFEQLTNFSNETLFRWAKGGHVGFN